MCSTEFLDAKNAFFTLQRIFYVNTKKIFRDFFNFFCFLSQGDDFRLYLKISVVCKNFSEGLTEILEKILRNDLKSFFRCGFFWHLSQAPDSVSNTFKHSLSQPSDNVWNTFKHVIHVCRKLLYVFCPNFTDSQLFTKIFAEMWSLVMKKILRNDGKTFSDAVFSKQLINRQRVF